MLGGGGGNTELIPQHMEQFLLYRCSSPMPKCERTFIPVLHGLDREQQPVFSLL